MKGRNTKILATCAIAAAVFASADAPGKDFDPAENVRVINRWVDKIEKVNRQGPFKPDWESLSKHTAAPQWFRDAKFGIYFHWGVYCVPEYGNEWYPCHMHKKKDHVHKHHVKTYGPPDKFGYHDFVPMFKAEKFDAERWVALFEKAGAKYIGPVAEHHDGYSMWDSEITPWNAAETGPKRDVTGMLAKAARKRGMKFVTSFHHARNRIHYNRVKGWPTASDDPKLRMLYGNMTKDKFHKVWLTKLAEVIDKYQPDLMWFDSWLDTIPPEHQRKYLAYYFNRAAQWDKSVVVTRKQKDLPLDLSVEDFEKGRAKDLKQNVWLTDDTISAGPWRTSGSWSYTSELVIKPPTRVIHDFIDIVSKNGCLLLNISPRSDGTIPDKQKEILLQMGAWLNCNGEAIYNTRPWKVYGEGPTKMKKGGHFVDEVKYTGKDVRYTRTKNDEALYAITLGWPEDKTIVLESVKASGKGKVMLLGYDKPLKYEIGDDGRISIEPPDLKESARPCKHAYVFKLTGFEISLQPSAG